MSDSEFTLFMHKCREDLCLPDDVRMDDFMEFLEAFTSEVREDVTTRMRRDLLWAHDNPGMSGPRGPHPDSDEADDIIDAAVREELRDCARKLVKLMEGLG